jgi:hypothetical protein
MLKFDYGIGGRLLRSIERDDYGADLGVATRSARRNSLAERVWCHNAEEASNPAEESEGLFEEYGGKDSTDNNR